MFVPATYLLLIGWRGRGRNRSNRRRKFGAVHVEDLLERGCKSLRFLRLLRCRQLPLIAGDRRLPASAATASAASPQRAIDAHWARAG